MLPARTYRSFNWSGLTIWHPKKSTKVYALLRDSLLETGLVDLARVVIQTRQHLTALMPTSTGLVLDLLRWEQDIRPMDELLLPPAGAQAVGPSEREMAMARQLIQDMAFAFKPASFADSFRQDIMALVGRKERERNLNILVLPSDDAALPISSESATNLADLLQRSLRKGVKPVAVDVVARALPE